MKKMNKLLALVLAMVMVLGLATVASAAEANLDGHIYKAYQIFKGTQAADSAELADIAWGDNVDGISFLAALKADATLGTDFAECQTANDVANVMKNWNDDSVKAEAFAKFVDANKTGTGVEVESGSSTLDAGYYLIVDTTTTNGVESAVKNLSLLQLTNKGAFVIRNKTDVPEVIKKVDDKNDSNNTQDDIVWEDSADYDIGDDVPFQITATLPTNLSDYKTYKLVFHDTQSSGLTMQPDTIVVKVGNTTLTKGTDYTYEPTGDGFTITIPDVIKHGATKDTQVTINYNATLNEHAVIGAMGNPNEVYMDYSNNPNFGGEGETGKTPVDKVIVFTYKTVVNKVTQNPAYDESKDEDKDGVDSDNNSKFIPLKGAGFTLYKKNSSGNYEAVGTEAFNAEMTTFTWTGLDDGDYKLVETTTPAGYNTIAPIEFTITADHDIEWTSQERTDVLNSLSGGNKFTGDIVAGTVTGDVENNKGTTLPETGGIGTTIFYVLGGMLVVCAVVLMVSKKRMSAEG